MFYDVELVEFWTRPGRFRALFYRALQKQHQSDNKSQSQLRKTSEIANETSKQRGTWGVLNTATPQQNRSNTASPQEILSTRRHRKIYLVQMFFFFFFFLNVITVTSTFQTQERHHKTILPPSPHVKFLAVAYT